jgi:hypothetical protein
MYGSTVQTLCQNKSEIDQALRGWPELLDKCQARKWEVDGAAK